MAKQDRIGPNSYDTRGAGEVKARAGAGEELLRPRNPPRLSEHPLDRPVHPDRGDRKGGRNRDAQAVPGTAAQSADQEEGSGEDRELAELDPGVEREERRHELRAGEAELGEDAREPEAVEQTEAEDESDPRFLELASEEVLDRDIDDRDRDQRLDDPRREVHPAEHREPERQRVGDRE